jgi:hypothetical protein
VPSIDPDILHRVAIALIFYVFDILFPC